jgi:hypothetical protein
VSLRNYPAARDIRRGTTQPLRLRDTDAGYGVPEFSSHAV